LLPGFRLLLDDDETSGIEKRLGNQVGNPESDSMTLPNFVLYLRNGAEDRYPLPLRLREIFLITRN